MTDIDIGLGKSARAAYGLEDISIVPSRRTRNPASVDLTWQIDAFTFAAPVLGAPMDSVTSPDSAIALGDLGGLGVLHLEGVWTRHEYPEPLLEQLAAADPADRRAILAKLYEPEVDLELVARRIAQIRAGGSVAAGAVSPQGAVTLAPTVGRAELDLLVISGTVVSAEHVSVGEEPLNLKRFVRELEVPVVVGGCSSYPAALHLMRTGAAGIMVGVGTGRASTTGRVLGLGSPLATAIADARAARMRHLDETGVYVHLIADGGIASGGDIAKAVVCGADAVTLGATLAASSDAPGRGLHWGLPSAHATLPRGGVREVEPVGTLGQILHGPAVDDSGRTNVVGALRKSMSAAGYGSLKEMQKAELVVLGAQR